MIIQYVSKITLDIFSLVYFNYISFTGMFIFTEIIELCCISILGQTTVKNFNLSPKRKLE